MAQLTAAALETSLNGSDTNRRFFQVVKSVNNGATSQFYVIALCYNSGRPSIKHGTSRWCTTTDANATTVQRDAVYTAMAN